MASGKNLIKTSLLTEPKIQCLINPPLNKNLFIAFDSQKVELEMKPRLSLCSQTSHSRNGAKATAFARQTGEKSDTKQI